MPRRTVNARLDCPEVAQALDLCRRVAEHLAENLGRVLADRGGSLAPRLRAAQLDRVAGLADGAPLGAVDLDDHLAGEDLRILQRLADGVDRRAGHLAL